MSEKELKIRFNKCLADGLVKLGTGMGLGIVFSVMIFKRQKWPISLCSGIGLGLAYSNCQNLLKSYYPRKRIGKEE